MNGMGGEKVLGYSSAELVLLQNGMHGKQTKKRTKEGRKYQVNNVDVEYPEANRYKDKRVTQNTKEEEKQKSFN